MKGRVLFGWSGLAFGRLMGYNEEDFDGGADHVGGSGEEGRGTLSPVKTAAEADAVQLGRDKRVKSAKPPHIPIPFARRPRAHTYVPDH